jgi:uncharacterized protein (DUF1778 family)
MASYPRLPFRNFARVTPEKRSIIKEHAESMGESATTFINRAIDEAMARDHEH